MKRLSATLLALAMSAATIGAASAQTYGGYNGNNGYATNGTSAYGNTRNVVPDRYGNSSNAIYDYARVIRVDPVIDQNGYANNTYAANGYGNQNGYNQNGYNQNGCYNQNGYTNQNGQHCYTSSAAGSYTTDRYGNRVVNNNGSYYPQQVNAGTDTGRTVATVVGGIAGALLGSKIGGGTGTYAATAIGSMVGGLAGRQVYETSQRHKNAGNAVEVCDPQDNGYSNNGYANNGYNNGYSNNGYNNGYSNNGYASNNVGNDGRVVGYNVTYEYMGRQFVTRTNYHPGDKIRVRVDVRPE